MNALKLCYTLKVAYMLLKAVYHYLDYFFTKTLH